MERAILGLLTAVQINTQHWLLFMQGFLLPCNCTPMLRIYESSRALAVSFSSFSHPVPPLRSPTLSARVQVLSVKMWYKTHSTNKLTITMRATMGGRLLEKQLLFFYVVVLLYGKIIYKRF